MNKNECVKNQYFTALLALEQDKVHGIRELSSLSLFRGLDFVMMMMMMMMRNLPGKRGKRREDFVPTFWSGTGRNIPPYVKVDCGEGGGGNNCFSFFLPIRCVIVASPLRRREVDNWGTFNFGGEGEGRNATTTNPRIQTCFRNFLLRRKERVEGGGRTENELFLSKEAKRSTCSSSSSSSYVLLLGRDR